MQAAQEQYKPFKPYYRNKFYDFNLKPSVPEKPAEPVEQVKPARQVRVAPVWDKLNILIILILGGTLSMGIVISSVYANEIQRTINRTAVSTQDINVEIDDIVVQINEGLDIGVIERRAVDELGMVYPLAEQFVHIEGFPHTIDFAQYIRERAYDPFEHPPLIAVCRYEGIGEVLVAAN